MQIDKIWVSQRKLRNVHQLAQMKRAIISGNILPPITVARCEDGELQLDDGHHRLVAYWLCGRTHLVDGEYFLVEKDRWKPRRGKVFDLIARIEIPTTDKDSSEKIS